MNLEKKREGRMNYRFFFSDGRKRGFLEGYCERKVQDEKKF